jgi:hypothetical protein
MEFGEQDDSSTIIRLGLSNKDQCSRRRRRISHQTAPSALTQVSLGLDSLDIQ